MKAFAKVLASATFLLSTVTAAYADPVNGSITIAGNDTFTQTSITFNPTTGTVTSASGTLSGYAPSINPNGTITSFAANLTSFAFASASGVTVFNIGTGLTFTINQLMTDLYTTTATGNSLTLAGNGYFTETGYDRTLGTFSLTSSNSQVTGFQISSGAAATPEPSSLVLLGTGLVGAAGLIFSRRRRFSL